MVCLNIAKWSSQKKNQKPNIGHNFFTNKNLKTKIVIQKRLAAADPFEKLYSFSFLMIMISLWFELFADRSSTSISDNLFLGGNFLTISSNLPIMKSLPHLQLLGLQSNFSNFNTGFQLTVNRNFTKLKHQIKATNFSHLRNSLHENKQVSLNLSSIH